MTSENVSLIDLSSSFYGDRTSAHSWSISRNNSLSEGATNDTNNPLESINQEKSIIDDPFEMVLEAANSQNSIKNEESREIENRILEEINVCDSQNLLVKIDDNVSMGTPIQDSSTKAFIKSRNHEGNHEFPHRKSNADTEQLDMSCIRSDQDGYGSVSSVDLLAHIVRGENISKRICDLAPDQNQSEIHVKQFDLVESIPNFTRIRHSKFPSEHLSEVLSLPVDSSTPLRGAPQSKRKLAEECEVEMKLAKHYPLSPKSLFMAHLGSVLEERLEKPKINEMPSLEVTKRIRRSLDSQLSFRPFISHKQNEPNDTCRQRKHGRYSLSAVENLYDDDYYFSFRSLQKSTDGMKIARGTYSSPQNEGHQKPVNAPALDKEEFQQARFMSKLFKLSAENGEPSVVNESVIAFVESEEECEEPCNLDIKENVSHDRNTIAGGKCVESKFFKSEQTFAEEEQGANQHKMESKLASAVKSSKSLIGRIQQKIVSSSTPKYGMHRQASVGSIQEMKNNQTKSTRQIFQRTKSDSNVVSKNKEQEICSKKYSSEKINSIKKLLKNDKPTQKSTQVQPKDLNKTSKSLSGKKPLLTKKVKSRNN